MSKNTTLLLKTFQLGKLMRPSFKAMTPLFQITVHHANFQLPLKKIVNNPLMNYDHIKTEFDRILSLQSNQPSNARKSVFLNTKRNDLIHYFNNNGEKSVIYVVYLFPINQFVPTEHLIQQLACVMNRKTIKNQPKFSKSQINNNKIANYFNNVLFPFNNKEWNAILQSNFPKTKNLYSHHFEQTYFFMQTSNLYMIQFSHNPQLMYQDFKDFDAFLGKFNFIRFFWQLNSNNEFIARKNSERLIKSLKWRTAQSEQYLLMLVRAHNWQKFILQVQDFCICYESLYEPASINSQMKQ